MMEVSIPIAIHVKIIVTKIAHVLVVLLIDVQYFLFLEMNVKNVGIIKVVINYIVD